MYSQLSLPVHYYLLVQFPRYSLPPVFAVGAEAEVVFVLFVFVSLPLLFLLTQPFAPGSVAFHLFGMGSLGPHQSYLRSPDAIPRRMALFNGPSASGPNAPAARKRNIAGSHRGD